ncbi:HAD family hydrolase [Streptomyces sp. NPDC046924]|uniref:HAD family hydrolase n=1 Tax=Streptomyces sp. NPDC046924 TaxID=3155136 RepID=UPI0033DEEB4E
MTAEHDGALRGVIFDMDGTLADTPGAIVSITLGVLAELGREADEDAVRATVGKPLDHNFSQLLGLPADHAEVQNAMAAYRRGFAEHLAEQRGRMLYPGVPKGLIKLRESGLTLAIATSKTHDAAVNVLRTTGILDEFTVVAGHDTVERGKPAPDMALHVAHELDIPAADCIVIGDAIGDIQMAGAAGMTSIGVSYGVATAAELLAAGAQSVADSFDDLVTVIAQYRRT